jgi:hypothetical protein
MTETDNTETTALPANTTVGIKRLSINLTDDAYADLDEISKQTRRSMTEIVRLGLGLVKLVLDEQRQKKNRLVIADSNLKPLREIVLPL